MYLKTFQSFESYLKNLEKFGMIFGLHNIQALLNSLGNPHESFKAVHIAGSNGKGSVAAMMQQVLTDSGLKCGLYTSPHLQRFSERFKIGGEEISQEDILKHANRLIQGINREQVPEGYTYFDFTTAMAFDYFAESGVDIAVIETGLGGRLDSTNILQPEIAVITPISLEHTQILGSTLAAIAAEKAGIMKENTPVILGKQSPPALSALLETAHALHAPAYVFGREYTLTIKGTTFDYHQGTFELKGMMTSLLGNHQKENAATAICALRTLEGLGISVSLEQLPESLKRVQWPGRGEIFENVSDPTIRLMLDGAHNPGGAVTLARTLKTLNFNRLHIVIGILADKDIEAIAQSLLSLANHVTAVTPHLDRAPEVHAFAERLRPYLAPKATLEIAGAITLGIPLAEKNLKSGDLLVITGSLYTVGEARDFIEKEPQWQKKHP